MSEKDGRLEEWQRQYVADWLNKKGTLIGKCSLCGARDWTVLPHIIVSSIWGADHTIGRVGGAGYLSAGLICTNCGNTHLINANHIGLIRDSKFLDEPQPLEVPKDER